MSAASMFAFGEPTQAEAVEDQPTHQPVFAFEQSVYDFGSMVQHDPAVADFHFTNSGDQGLIISTVKSSCGCVVADWPRQVIAPGESGVIRVKYDTKRVGPINRSVFLTSNASEPTISLRMKGNVAPVPDARVSDSPPPSE